MLDKERVIIKIDEFRKYLDELRQIMPENFKDYKKIEKKRSCERILQLTMECILDICKIIVSGLKLGVPSEENDLFEKLHKQNIIDSDMLEKLKEMRGFRNILVHKYTEVDDEIVFDVAQNGFKDFENIINAIILFIKN